MNENNTIIARGSNGKAIKMVKDINENTKVWTDIVYDYKDRIIERRETTVMDGKAVDEYVQQMAYHDNGELLFCGDNRGCAYHFNEKGLPIR